MSSLTSFTSLARALSPPVQAFAATAGAQPSDRRDLRAVTIMSCNTVVEVIECIPSDYRSQCADFLNDLRAATDRLARARSTLAKWKHHKSVGTLPPALKGSAPKVQFSAGYAGTAEARQAEAEIVRSHEQHMVTVLTSWIAAREAEVAHIEKETAPDVASLALRSIVLAQSLKVVDRYKVPVETVTGGDGDDAPMTDVHWETSPAALSMRDDLLADCPALVSRTVSITVNIAAQQDMKIEKKRKIANAATTAAADDVASSSAGGTLTDAVKAEVRRVVMGILPPEVKSKARNKMQRTAKVSAESTRYHVIADFFSESSSTRISGDHRSRWDAKVRLHRPLVHPSLPRTQYGSFLEQEQAQRSRPGREGSCQARREAQGTGGHRQGRGSAAAAADAQAEAQESSEGEEVEWQLDSSIYSQLQFEAESRSSRMTNSTNARGRPPLIAAGELWISQPKTMPDILTQMPLPCAVEYVLSHCSLQWLDSMSFQQYVHLSPGVSCPREIAFQLSLGSRYMFHQPTNANLIKEAWTDFDRRLRWRIQFMFEGGPNEPYDRDYDLKIPNDKAPPALPQYIEIGLDRGRLFAEKAMAIVPDPQGDVSHWRPDVRAIKDFLISEKYVVTNTDKNLGIAVSRRDWIVEKCQDALRNINDYKPLLPAEANNILDLKCVQMRRLARRANENYALGKQLAEFLRSGVTARGKVHHIPTFYGIPKIHKVPTKMRPIIPCHTAIMNPAAKFASKRLKPIVESAPTIIHGTKDLAQKLSKLSIDPNRNWYIVTGDVVAFYPNIPLELCLNIVSELHFEHYFAGQVFPYSPHNVELQQFFDDAVKIGNTQLLTQFQGQIYQQLNGLAMGVADSPDLANLFGYYFERKSDVLNHPNIFYYGRYIDDCLAIVYADSNQDAINLLSNLIRFDNCVIEWAKPGSSQPFLDMLLYQDGNNELQHMPYRKAGNHQERIPWISAHPYDVKRGTFLGEMSRLAVLSSTFKHYTDALIGLVSLYIHRGYPADEVHKWLYSNIQVRWEKRLLNRQPTTDANTLVLKSEYNLAWNYFNAHEFGQSIFDYWRTWLERHEARDYNTDYPAPVLEEGEALWNLGNTDIFNSRVLVSRKRTRNFLDLTNLWKKTVLEAIEGDVLSDLMKTVQVAQAGAKRPREYTDYDVNTRLSDTRPMKRTREYHSDSDEEINVHRRSSSPRTGNLWASGSAGTWGRGARP